MRMLEMLFGDEKRDRMEEKQTTELSAREREKKSNIFKCAKDRYELRSLNRCRDSLLIRTA